MPYSQGRIAYKHYGKYVERMIRGLADERNPQTVARTVDNLARYMRTKSYEYKPGASEQRSDRKRHQTHVRRDDPN